MQDLQKLTKKELEELGREYGVELDRRLSKKALVEEVESILVEQPDCGCGQTEDENGKCDGSHNDISVDLEEEVVVKPKKQVSVPQKLLTKRTKPAGRKNKYFVDSNGEILKFATESAARSTARKYDGKRVAKDGYWIVRSY